MNKKYLIIYHFEDNDGVCSAALIMDYLVKNLNIPYKDIVLFGANYAILAEIYKNNFDFVINKKDMNMLTDFYHVTMTDVSFNDFNAIKKLYEVYGQNLLWIDHHAPIINESIRQKYDTLINGVRDTHRSAILNAYKYCYDPFDINYLDGNVPYILRVLSAWDSYSFENEKIDFEFARRVSMGFTTIYNLDIDLWYKNMGSILNAGKSYNEDSCNIAYKTGSKEVEEYDKRNEKLLNSFGMPGFTVNGRKAILLFMSEGTSSLIFKTVKNKYQNGICAKASPDGNILISLYNTSNEDHSFHCGEYLHSKYKGGGHEGAAGATLPISTFIEVMKTKKL